MTINLNTLFHEHYKKGKQLLDVVTHGKTNHWNSQQIKKYLRKHHYEFTLFSPETIEWIVYCANQMAKDNTCPHNQMNRFYKWKHKYIKRQIQKGNVVETYESEKHYRFVFKSGISFHQLKDAFPNGVPYETKPEAYEREAPNVMYDESFFNDAIIQIALSEILE